MKSPYDILFRAQVTVSKSEYNYNPDVAIDRHRERVIQTISHAIAREKIEKVEHDHHVDYRMELYVATPKEFWEIVEREAMKIARFMR